MRQGEHKSYYEDSTLHKIRNYLNGKLHGERRTYRVHIHGPHHGDNILWYNENFVNGKRHGESIWYDEDGTREFTTYYIMDEKVTETNWLAHIREEKLNVL